MSIESYQHIRNFSADNKINQSVVIDKDRPAVASMFGMVKQFILNRTQSTDQRAARNEKVKQNFLAAIKQQYGAEIAEGAKNKMKDLTGGNLKARHVRVVLNFADDKIMRQTGNLTGELSDPVKQLLGEEVQACEKLLKGAQNKIFMAAHKLSKDEMTALLCVSGMVENDQINPEELITSLKDRKHKLTPLTEKLSSALLKLPYHKGTVYAQTDVSEKDSVKAFLGNTGVQTPIKPILLVRETLSPEDRRQFGVPGNSPHKALISLKSDSGRQLKFGDESITNEFMVYINPTSFLQTGSENAPLLGKGAIKVSFEEV